MSKLTELDFNDGIGCFLSILQRQPNLFQSRPTSSGEAEDIAEMAVAFSVRYNELKQKHVGQ